MYLEHSKEIECSIKFGINDGFNLLWRSNVFATSAKEFYLMVNQLFQSPLEI